MTTPETTYSDVITDELALEEAAKSVEDDGWYQSSPDVPWDVVETQIAYSAATVRALAKGGANA